MRSSRLSAEPEKRRAAVRLSWRLPSTIWLRRCCHALPPCLRVRSFLSQRRVWVSSKSVGVWFRKYVDGERVRERDIRRSPSHRMTVESRKCANRRRLLLATGLEWHEGFACQRPAHTHCDGIPLRTDQSGHVWREKKQKH